MPIKYLWDKSDPTIIHVIYQGFWTWDDYTANARSIASEIANTTGRVDMICDMTRSAMLPPGPAISYMQQARSLLPPNFGINVIVGGNILLKSLTDLMIKLYGDPEHTNFMVSSTRKAQELIQSHRLGHPQSGV